MIGIRMVKKEGQITFSIEDQGPSIREEAKKHIFDKFYQEDSSHEEEGNGLGLALVKKTCNCVREVSRRKIFREGDADFRLC